jgi:hypothetical protein
MMLHFIDEDEYVFYFPDASNFDRRWKESKTDPSQNYYIKSSLRSVFDWIDAAEMFGESPRDKIWDLIESSTSDSRALVAAGATTEWHEKSGGNAYNNARAAISLLDQAYEDAITRGWNSVALFCLQKITDLECQLGSAGSTEVERAVDLIGALTDTSDVHLGNLSEALQLLVDNKPILNPQGHHEKRAFVLCIKQANRLRNQKQFFQERSLLSTTIKLAEILNIPTADLEDRYVETYRLNADLQSERSSSLEAQELVQALEDQNVLDRLSDDEKEEWKSRLRSAVQSAAQELKREGAVIDSPHQRFLHQSNVERFVRQFEQIKYVYDTGAALFWLLTRDELLPEHTDDSVSSNIHDILSQKMYSLQGHLIEFDSDNADITSRYAIEARIAISTVVSVISTLISNGSLAEAGIYNYLSRVPDLDQENQWYLTRFISNVFDGNDLEAIHLGATRIEAILYNLLREEGEDVDALMDDGTGTRTLGSLIPKLNQYVSVDFQEYIRYTYNEPVGQMFNGNIRNRVSHGLLLPRENNRLYSLLILTDLLRIVTRMNRTVHHARYGIPATVLIPTQGLPFPLVIRSYGRSDFPDEDSFLEYLDGQSRTVGEVADHFDISYRLALIRIRLSEVTGDVLFDEKSGVAEKDWVSDPPNLPAWF